LGFAKVRQKWGDFAKYWQNGGKTNAGPHAVEALQAKGRMALAEHWQKADGAGEAWQLSAFHAAGGPLVSAA
jgi:hypothetical protein